MNMFLSTLTPTSLSFELRKNKDPSKIYKNSFVLKNALRFFELVKYPKSPRDRKVMTRLSSV